MKTMKILILLLTMGACTGPAPSCLPGTAPHLHYDNIKGVNEIVCMAL